MQHVAALLQQAVKKFRILRHIDLAGLGQLARRQHFVKPGQRLRIPPHVVHIGHILHHIGVKQHRNAAAFQILIGDVYRRAAA